jgi:formylmethanofuran dehydrogenase subunit C
MANGFAGKINETNGDSLKTGGIFVGSNAESLLGAASRGDTTLQANNINAANVMFVGEKQ